MDDEDDKAEKTAQLENQAVEAMMELISDYGYTESDLENLVHNAVTG